MAMFNSYVTNYQRVNHIKLHRFLSRVCQERLAALAKETQAQKMTLDVQLQVNLGVSENRGATSSITR